MQWGRKHTREILLDPLDEILLKSLLDANPHRTGYFLRGYPCLQIHGRGYKLHSLLIGSPRDGLEIDHINRDKLDNRRSNLRIVTHKGNMENSVQSLGPSGIRGIAYISSCPKKPWRVLKGRRFRTLKEAEKYIEEVKE